MSEHASCETCRFFKLWRNETVCGVCCAHPPTVHVCRAVMHPLVTVWPEVKTENWCGEHKPKEK